MPDADWPENDGEGVFRHSQRKLDARRDRLRKRARRRRRSLEYGAVAFTVVAIVAVVLLLRPHSVKSRPDGPMASASQVAQAVADRSHLLAGWRPSTHPVPILMYHRLQAPGTGSGARELFVSPELFRAQLTALKRHGYTPVTMRDLTRAWIAGGLLPRKPIVLTFDDGYRTQYTVGFQAMRKLGWPGVLYLLPNSTGIPVGPTDRQVREMLAAGWELGAHTINHRNLRNEMGADLREQTAGARALLRHRYGKPVTAFAYPMGEYNKATIGAVRNAGYTSATTVAPGLGSRDQPYELNRIRVDQSDTPAVLLQTLAQRGRPAN